MQDLCRLIFWIASDLLRSRVALEAEILVLRQQINVLRRANYPPDERRLVGSTEDPWRASQAWHRCRSDQRGQIYGAEEGSSLAGMEDVPS
jgi:hypothetical protein